MAEDNNGNGGVGIAWAGAAICWIGNRLSSEVWQLATILAVGVAVAVFGGILWAQRKNRHWAFGLWALLAPIGFLGISLLKEKPRNT